MTNYLSHRQWMNRAVELAQAAGDAGEVPVGAVIVDGTGKLIAQAQNRRERDCDPTAHACPMCAGAIVQARIGLLVYGADDPKTGTIRTVANIPDSAPSCHRLSVIGGIMESVCRQQLLSWFEARRGEGEKSDRC